MMQNNVIHGAVLRKRAKEAAIRMRHTFSEIQTIERRKLHKKQFGARVAELLKLRIEIKKELIERMAQEKIKNPNSGIVFMLALDDWIVAQAKRTASKLHIQTPVHEGKLRMIKGKRRQTLIKSIAHLRSEMFSTSIQEEEARLKKEIEAKQEQIAKTARTSRI